MLLDRAKQAGLVREDVRSGDVLRLSHGLILATDAAPSDPDQADRLIGLLVDGLLAGGSSPR